jgi:hypothetical protein
MSPGAACRRRILRQVPLVPSFPDRDFLSASRLRARSEITVPTAPSRSRLRSAFRAATVRERLRNWLDAYRARFAVRPPANVRVRRMCATLERKTFSGIIISFMILDPIDDPVSWMFSALHQR